MKRLILLPIAILLASVAQAFHIVGGEIELIYLSEGRYRINVIQYFDEAQEDNPGPEPTVEVHIFRNSDDALMLVQLLAFQSQEIVNYTNPECSIAELQTSRVVWSSEVELDPEEYEDEEGYYIVWERCCRNDDIVNIVNPDATGMTYILDFPALIKDGQSFKNSSPILFQPLGDYACINQLYYVEFTGVDPDNDSLVYSLATPLNSSAAVAVPIPTPKPHPEVFFSGDYSVNNMIPGSPPLKISEKGLLTVTPFDIGLYVFSVRVEEYRAGEKIGETRRDFQMLVIDGCEPPDPPSVDIDIPGNPTFDPVLDTLTYTVGEEKCFDFLVFNVTEGETISFEAQGVNFDEDLNDIFTLNQVPILDQNELQIEVCIPDCPPVRNEPFIVDLIASDDACPLPQLDTLRLAIFVEPPPNQAPNVPANKTIVVDEDSMYSEMFSATDADGDSIETSLYIAGFEDPIQIGMDLDVIESEVGSTTVEFIWNTDCLEYDFSSQQEFDVGIIFDDLDTCAVPGDTLWLRSIVVLPPNTDPVVTASTANGVNLDLGDLLSFQVFANDSDGDNLSLSFIGGNFNPQRYGMNFADVTGGSAISSEFSWNTLCNTSLYDNGQSFTLNFVANDDDKCKQTNYDTLSINVVTNYPDNIAPTFENVTRFRTVGVNEELVIPVTALDADGDFITLSLAEGIRQPSSGTLSFETVRGQGSVVSNLIWQPECSLLRTDETSTVEEVFFQVVDEACLSEFDTLKLTFEITDDADRFNNFDPPNVFTPNNDGKNDAFTLTGNLDATFNLPADNCDNSFERIVVTNRAGGIVFESSNRDFSWSGDAYPAGVYFYAIHYTSTEYKGFIHLIR